MKPLAIIRAAIVSALIANASGAYAQSFDPRSLTPNERIFIQEGLIWRGGYNTLTDGGWGPASISALSNWRRSENLPADDTSISAVEIDRLARQTAARHTAVGWKSWEHLGLGLQISFPGALTGLEQPVASDDGTPGLNFQQRGERGRIFLSVRVGDRDWVNGTFNLVDRWIGEGRYERLYRLNRSDRQVIAYQSATRFGYVRYDRSDRAAPNAAAGAWKGFSLQIDRDVGDYPILVTAISASFSASIIRRPRFNQTDMPNLYAPLAALLLQGEPGTPPVAQRPTQPFAAAPAPRPAGPTQPFAPPSTPPQPAAAAPAPPPPRQPQQAGSGTAFVVRRDGTLLTNAHVVDGCALVTLDSGEALRVVVSDRRRDLAILQNRDLNFPRELRFRRDQTIDLGETTNLFGYPYYGDGTTALNVTTGNVSALTGLNDNPLNFQLSSPLQPGNSGGPVLDAGGAVIGVAVARLTGGGRDAPQNVNYAIRGSIAEAFLLENGILVEKTRSTQTVALREIAADATPLVRPVICWR